MNLPKLKAILAHVATVASFVVIANDKLKELPFTPPAWVSVGLAGAAVLAGAVLHFLPSPGALTPTKTEPLENLGPVAGKASGEAFTAASKGPFRR